jgi:hypothetical protein
MKGEAAAQRGWKTLRQRERLQRDGRRRNPTEEALMSSMKSMPMRIGLAVLACATSLSLPAPLVAAPATASSPAPAVPEGKAFVQMVQSGELDAESYDFVGAGFFKRSPQERRQWQIEVFSALGLGGQSPVPQCTPVARRNSVALAWAQLAGQSTDADDWQVTAGKLRARLAELDQMLKHSAPETPSADPLVQELLARFARDQDVRNIFNQRKWTEGLSPAAANNWMLAASTRMEAIDCDNTAWLKAQLPNIGWFTIPRYGAEADSAAWHLVQHADREPAFQREMLMKLQALPPGQTNDKRLGYLFDRVARAEGRLQRYGTQGQCKDGQWTPFESEDSVNLDKRRASLGMEPIAEHMKTVSREACPR